jgi:tripartite-type tricarboxylate transporter receptor subunit TctC
MKNLLLCILLLFSGLAHAWPTKEITIVVPYPPGGVNDQLARFMLPDLESILKVPVVVKNMPGAANSVAINYIVNQPNDNHTFMINMDDFVLGPLYQGNRSYTNFTAVNIIGRVPYVLFGGAKADLKKFKQQISQGVVVNVGNNGVNGGAHLWISGLKSKLDINSIYYKGSSPVLADVTAGHTEYGVSSIAASYQFVKEGRLQPMMTSGQQRNNTYPTVPTAHELGFTGLDSQTWFGVFTRKDTTSEAINRFGDVVGIIVKNNSRIQEFSNSGMNIINLRGKKATDFFDLEIKHFEHTKQQVDR